MGDEKGKMNFKFLVKFKGVWRDIMKVMRVEGTKNDDEKGWRKPKHMHGV